VTDPQHTIVDQYGRRFQNLRVSLTAACNYACTYCVPKGEKRRVAKHELRGDKLIYLVALLKEVTGLKRLRITGGEPLIAPQFDDFISAAGEMDFEDLSLTTNGQFLEQKLPLIQEAGVKRINVSLDTLNPRDFFEIAKAGDLSSVLTGIEKALAVGIKVKLNMVPLKTSNIDQIIPLLEFSLERGIELRFIELMRMGHLSQGPEFSNDYIPMDYLLREIGQHYDFERTDAPYDSTAARFEIPGKGYFGVIANESEPFCATCTRLRLSSSGFLHGCLSSSNKHSIAHLIDLPKEKALSQLIETLNLTMADKQMVFKGGETIMRVIGG